MITVDGKAVYTELDEVAAPEHTALVLVDFQRDFVEPGAAYDRAGMDLSMYPPMRQCAYALLQSARLFALPVVHLQMTLLGGSRSESPAQLRFNARMAAAIGRPVAAFKYCLAGTDGHRFLPEFEPADGETVVSKWRSSGFAGTGLDLMLRSNAVQSLVIAGCTTEGCVESTARDALFLDYHVVIAEDCVASHSRAQHDASLFLMRHRFDVAPGARIVEAWAAARERIVTPAARAADE